MVLPIIKHVIWTSHALEPNGGNEREAVAELLRVARKNRFYLSLIKKKTLLKLRIGCIGLDTLRGLPNVIKECGATCDEIILLKNISNPLNPTHAFITTPPYRPYDKA